MIAILRKYGVLPMTIVSVILLAMFFSLSSNLDSTYGDIEKNIAGKVICVNTATPEEIARVLRENNYVKNDADAQFIARILCNRIQEHGPVGSLFDIRKNDYRATVQEVEEGNSETYKDLYRQMCDELEQADSVFVGSNVNQSVVTINPSFKGKIEINVWKKDEESNFLKRSIKLDRKPCANVYIRLNEHNVENPDGVTVASIRTNDNGEARFEGLNDSCSYSVLPISVGHKYGSAKGTVHATLKEVDGEYSFEQSPIMIPLLSQPVLRQIKEDNTIIVRTLSDFKGGLSSRFWGIIIFWWFLYILCLFLKRPVDTYLTSALLGLTGLCCLIMHSLNNPLTDTLLGEETTQGVAAGCVIVFALQWLDLTHFYQNKYVIHFDLLTQFGAWLCKPFKKKMEPLVRKLKSRGTLAQVFYLLSIIILYIPLRIISIFPNKLEGKIKGATKGIGYLILSIMLTALLFTPLGTEVGGMKVNLNLFGIRFQPSEIAKYLFVGFMAAYFCRNANKIIALDSIGKAKLFNKKLWNLFALLLGFGILMGLYIKLQDLGPAMVIIFTFIILYSIIKSKDKIDKIGKNVKYKDIFCSDFAILVFGVISFLFVFYLGKIVGAPGVACLAWFVLWIGVGLSRFKQIHETSIMFNLVLAAFIFGSSLKDIPNESISRIGERLETRTAMCSNTWGKLGLNGSTTEATTNSQVADGLWGLATGGLDGQGLSNGECSLIPAFNTDMILESIGTQTGFLGLLFVLVLYFFLFRRALVVGYKSNHPFTFYLCVGVGIVTGVQLAIIALGSTGVIPLTGITVPLLSYGKVSMILNLFAFGLVLTVSSHNTPTPSIGQGVKPYNNTMSLLTWSFVFVTGVIGATFFYYQWIDRNETLIRPVLAKDATGLVTLKYNPRISALVDKMRIGSIYDRNGVLLATSDKDELAKYDKEYAKCNIKYHFEGKQKRYYPFGEHLFFMVGDYNTKLFFSGSNRGLLAENKYLETLRGYDNRLVDENGNTQYVYISSSDIYENRFLDKKTSSDTVKTVLRDYSALIPYLKAGINSKRINDFNNDDESFFSMGKIKPADIHLLVDAVLQTKLQDGIMTFVENDPTLSKKKKVRVSAVVLNATTGELLSSANYPLPDLETLPERPDVYRDASIKEAYTDMDLGLFFATQPGSTAKVMSAISSLMKDSLSENFICPIRDYEKPSSDSYEPILGNSITMETAIKLSSNVYFIKLLNEKNAYEELRNLYSYVGILINQNRPYDDINYQTEKSAWTKTYNDIVIGEVERYNSIKKSNLKSKDKKRLAGGAFNFAWGQWPVEATPLSMAKVAAIVANKGILSEIRINKKDKEATYFIVDSVRCKSLSNYMKLEAREHTSYHITDYNAGGKTGTVLRPDGKGRKRKDAWYICFCNNKEGGQIAIALRIERGEVSSPKAKQMVRDVVLKTLDEMGYIKK